MRILQLLLIVGVLASPSAFAFAAGAGAGKTAVAAQHFEAGRAHVKDKHFELAAREFRASIDAEPNVGAWLNLGECLEALHNLEGAYEAYRNAQALAAEKRDDRMTLARSGAERIESKALRLSVRPADAGSSDVSVELDGSPIPKTRWSKILTTPSVSHRLVARRSKDGETFTREVAGRAGEELPEILLTFNNESPAAQQVEVPKSAAIPASPPPQAEEPHAPPPPSSSSSGSTQRTVGIAIAGVGALGLIGSGIFGAMTLGAESDLDRELTAANCTNRVCDRASAGRLVPLHDRATDLATVANVLLVTGGIVLVTGVVIALIAKSPPRLATSAAIAW